MSFVVEVQNEFDYIIDAQALIRAAYLVLTEHEIRPESEMTIVISNNERVAALNQQFRGFDAPTDVLSFPSNEGLYLGDIIIAYAYTRNEAQCIGFSLKQTMMMLVVHGTLHLLGYDHDTPDNREIMWRIQNEILQRLEIAPEIVP